MIPGPYGFYMFSHDYFKAAKAASAVDFGKRINYPGIFLYCRLWSSPKSVLLATKKYKLENLASRRVFGHDISMGLSLVEKESLQKDLVLVSEEDKKMINDLNKWYKTDEKKFEYYGLLTGLETFREETVKRESIQRCRPLNI